MHMTTAAEAVKLIRSHDSVYIQGSTSIPEVLVRAMADRGEELRGVKVYSGFAVGRADAPYCRAEYRDSFLVNSLFVANNIRRWLAEGYGQSIPAFLGEIPGFFRDGTLPVDVALLNLSRPNAEGYCSYGVSADLAVSAVECAKTVIAQINDAMPFSYGDALIHTSRIAAAVEVNDPLVEVPSATPNEVESRIGGYIAEMIPDGATLQIGVGGIPNAVLAALHDHKHLGLHTEAMTDGVLPLLESDLLTIMEATTNGTLDKTEVRFRDGAAACVILASGGYPLAYEKGKEITGLDNGQLDAADVTVYHAGTAVKEGRLVTNGGRVLGVTATADTLPEALKKAYAATESIHFDKLHKRSDIGARALAAMQ